MSVSRKGPDGDNPNLSNEDVNTLSSSSTSIPKSLHGPRLWRSPASLRSPLSSRLTTRKDDTNGSSCEISTATSSTDREDSKCAHDHMIETEKERKEENSLKNDSASVIVEEFPNVGCDESSEIGLNAHSFLADSADLGNVVDEDRPSSASDVEDVPLATVETASADYDIPFPPPPPPSLELLSSWSEDNKESADESIATGFLSSQSVPSQALTSTSGDLSRSGLLAAIRDGVALRQVPQEVKDRPAEPGKVKVVDVQSELREKFMKRRKEQAEVMKSEIDQHQDRIEQVKQWVLEAQYNNSSLKRLQMLLEEVKQVQALVKVSPDLMKLRTSWPSELVDSIAIIVDFLNAFQQQVVRLERLCSTALASIESADAGAVPVNTDAVWTVVKGIVLNVKAMQDGGSRYARAAMEFTVSSSDVGDLIRRAADATLSLLNVMFPRALQSVESVYEPGLTKYDQTFRACNSRRLLGVCCQLNDNAVTFLNSSKHALYSDAQLKIKDLEDSHSQAFNISHRSGDWDTAEDVKLRPSAESRSLSLKRMSGGTLRNIVEIVKAGNAEHVFESLQACSSVQSYQGIEKELLTTAVATGNCQVIDAIMHHREKLSVEPMTSGRQFDVIHEAIVKGKLDCISHLVQHHGWSVNCRSTEAGNTPLHIAARRPDYVSLALLIRLGADVLMMNHAGRNVLQLLAVKEFPQVSYTKLPEMTRDSHLNLLLYINNPSLSDVVLVSEEDGEMRDKFFAHRVILCAQSEVFKAMMESQHWSGANENEIVLADVRPAVLSALLQYLYTGSCLFPRDDLNLAIDLMSAADRYLLFPMKLQCEAVLADRIDSEIVVPLYSAAFRFNAHTLLGNCCHFLLENYEDIDDPGHATLVHMLENSRSKHSQSRTQPHKLSIP